MPVDAFRIDIPASWAVVPVESGALAQVLDRLRASEGWAELPTIDQRQVELFFRRFLEDVKQADVRFAAVFAEFASEISPGGEEATPNARTADGVAENSEGDTLLASCTATVVGRESLSVQVPLTAEVILAAMSFDSVGGTATSIESPSTVEITCGTAVRLLRLVSPDTGGRIPLKCFIETYLIPVPPEFDHVLIVQFATPNVKHSRVFSELFAAIADNVRMYEAGAPTTL